MNIDPSNSANDPSKFWGVNNSQTNGDKAAFNSNSGVNGSQNSREVGESLGQAPSLSTDLNKLLSKLELTKTGSFTGTDGALVFKVNYPYLQEKGFLKVQNDLLEVNKAILQDYNLNERVLNYKIESFPVDKFPNRNNIKFKPSHDFQYGSEIVNIPNIHDRITDKPIFPDYDSRLLVPVLVGPPSLADLKTNSGLRNNLTQGISQQAFEFLEKAANRESEKKIDFHVANALHLMTLPNGQHAILNDSDLLSKFGFSPDNLKFNLEPEYVLSSENTIQLALKEKRPYNRPPTTPPVIDDLLEKFDIRVTDNNPKIEDFKFTEDNLKRYMVTNTKMSLIPAAAVDHKESAGLVYYMQERFTRPMLSPSPSLPHIVDQKTLPVIPAAFLHDRNAGIIFPRESVR